MLPSIVSRILTSQTPAYCLSPQAAQSDDRIAVRRLAINATTSGAARIRDDGAFHIEDAFHRSSVGQLEFGAPFYKAGGEW